MQDDKLDEALRAAIQKKGANYRPRSRHLTDEGRPKYVNRLIRETSPYLLQHAHNPVNWFPWGPEAFARARKEDKPILLSVGYSTCHWCHVMEHESFEDMEIATLLNKHFIAIKVDREERPDIDDIYMRAVRVLSGRGGWPMTVIMTPDKDPFFGGTYIPARDGDRGARQGLLSLLNDIRRGYEGDRAKLVEKAQDTSRKVMAAAAPQKPGDLPGRDVLEQAARALVSRHDGRWGGFGRAPKFPRPAALEFLMRFSASKDAAPPELQDEARAAALLTLDKMASGGIFDQVGGGFHRYSTDAKWLVPHFEKMLYDNAQLASSYLHAFQLTGEVRYAEVTRRTLDYLLREMQSPAGGFYSATDADSMTPSGHAEEGYFFTWTQPELQAALAPEELAAVTAYHAVSPRGNFEGRSILYAPRSIEDVAKEVGESKQALSRLLHGAYEKLDRTRRARPAPGLDDKVLTGWNGLTIAALSEAGAVLKEPRYTEAARQAADFLLEGAMTPEGRLLRTSRVGESKQPAFLEDYAFLISGLLELFQAGAERKYFEAALRLTKQLDDFWDGESGGYFKTGEQHEKLLSRDKPSYDGAVPSGNSVMTENLLLLASLTGEHAYREKAELVYRALASHARDGVGAPRLLASLQSYSGTSLQVVVVRKDREELPTSDSLAQACLETFLPGAVRLNVEEGDSAELASLVPLLEGKRALGGVPTAYVCEAGRCELPAKKVEELEAQLTQFVR